MTVTGAATMTVGAGAVAAGGRRRSNGPFEIKDLQIPIPNGPVVPAHGLPDLGPGASPRPGATRPATSSP
jgi:hypothetical protein